MFSDVKLSSFLVAVAATITVLFANAGFAQAFFPGVRATTVDVPPADFSFVTNPAPEFASINISQEGDDLVFTPNGSEPGNTFGFAEATLDDIPFGLINEANFLVVVVNLSYEAPPNQNILPTFRARLHERSPDGNFLSSGTTEIQSDGLRNRGGAAGLRLPFDRNRLNQDTNDLLLALDFFNFEGDMAEPGFELRVTDVRYYITEGDAHSTPEITSAYVGELGGLFMNITGHDGQFFVDQSIEAYAYDNQYMVAIDFPDGIKDSEKGGSLGADLYGYIARNVAESVGQTPIDIAVADDFDVLQAAVNGPEVVFTSIDPADGQLKAYCWNFISKPPPIQIGFGDATGNLDSILASDDFGTFLFVFEETGDDLSVYEFNLRRTGPVLPSEPVIDSDAAIINGRSMVCIDRMSSTKIE